MAGPLFGLLVLNEVAMRWHLKFDLWCKNYWILNKFSPKKFQEKIFEQNFRTILSRIEKNPTCIYWLEGSCYYPDGLVSIYRWCYAPILDISFAYYSLLHQFIPFLTSFGRPPPPPSCCSITELELHAIAGPPEYFAETYIYADFKV